MPIHPPKKGEKQKDFISRCIKVEIVDRPQKQATAICFDVWRRSKKKK